MMLNGSQMKIHYNNSFLGSWPEANQRYLSAALAVVRERLEQHAQRANSEANLNAPASSPSRAAQEALQQAAKDLPDPSALDTLCVTFGLSPFERDVLLLCAGPELDSTFAACCAAAQGDSMRAFPTFSLALAALPASHWSALTPAAPLRRWRLVEVGAGSTLTLSPLRIDERVLHYLTGVQHLDERLAGIVEPLVSAGELTPSHHELTERIVGAWSQAAGKSVLPVIQLCGDETVGKRAIAAAACETLGLHLSLMSAHSLPLGPGEFDGLLRLWEREAALSGCALLLECGELDATDIARERAITRFTESTRGALIVATRERRRVWQRTIISFDVRKPTTNEQRAIWQGILDDKTLSLNGRVEALVSQFSLNAQTIHAAAFEALGREASGDGQNPPPLNPPQSLGGRGASNEFGNVFARLTDAKCLRLWDACRAQARPRLDDLAQRIEPAATWDNLVLPEPQRQMLRDMAAHVRQRATVYETWGFGSRGARGLGISALFAGASGTGKTMAAEVLANELRLDLCRIDLSQVVNKYIGETEKNLRRVFDAAEEGGAILLFDEADALFGKRSEVKDSHDRYANIEVSYLLQRMETYRGLAILTTNMKSALDTAFLRRIRFVVQFPFPDTAQRAEIWRRIFPSSTPTEGLDVAKLARLNVAGGNIRNIALNAAFLAADAGEPVRMMHLLRAARSEYGKLEKSLTDTEIGGWV